MGTPFQNGFDANFIWLHQEKHKKISDFIDFLALKHVILKLKVQKLQSNPIK